MADVEIRGAQNRHTATRTTSPPLPTTAAPKRNNPPRIPHHTFYRHP